MKVWGGGNVKVWGWGKGEGMCGGGKGCVGGERVKAWVCEWGKGEGVGGERVKVWVCEWGKGEGVGV